MTAPASSDHGTQRAQSYGPLVAAGGLAVIAAMTAAFAVLLGGVAETEGLATFDLPIVQALADARTPVAVLLMRTITTLGSPVAMIVIAACVCGVLAWWLRRGTPLVLGALGVGGIGVIDTAAKDVVARPRPPAALHAVTANGYSFPSGHAVFSALVMLLCAAMLSFWVVHRPGGRVLLWAGSVTVIVAVGLSRVDLGVHYPSDILAGWALAIAWATTLGLATLGWSHARRDTGHLSSTGTDR